MRPTAHALFAFLALGWGADCFAQQEPPKQIRICVQLIEVAHPDLTELLETGETNGSVLHDRTLALVKEGKAKHLDSAMVVSRSGQKATLESLGEIIYPTEYNPPGDGLFAPLPTVTPPRTPPLRPSMCTAFETRNTGVNIEVEPTLDENDQIIDLRIVPEWTRLDRLETIMEHRDEWGDASIRMPVFEIWRTNTAVTLMAGKFELASVITPKPQPRAPGASRKLLVFVRADVIQTGGNGS